MDVTVKVIGLRELASAFKKMDAELPQELKVRFLVIAETVAGVIRGKVPRRSGRAQASVKARGSTRGASIAVGGTAAPYYPWLDFGGSVGRGHIPGRSGSGSIRRTMIEGGRYLYPALESQKEETIEAVDQAIKEVAIGAGFETDS